MWKDIEGYEGLYEVSDSGEVRSILTHKLKSQSGGNTKYNRYKYVTLYFNNVGTKLSVHRLVGKAFVPNPNNDPNVLHKDGDRFNNSHHNLKWGTQYDNIQDAKGHQTFYYFEKMPGESNPLAKLTENDVKEIRRLREEGYTQEALSEKFKVSRGTIRPILSGKSWKHVK